MHLCKSRAVHVQAYGPIEPFKVGLVFICMSLEEFVPRPFFFLAPILCVTSVQALGAIHIYSLEVFGPTATRKKYVKMRRFVTVCMFCPLLCNPFCNINSC